MDRQKARKRAKRYQELFNQMEKNRRRDLTFEGQVITLGDETFPHRIRFYSAGEETAPLYLDIHGGGMCWGTIEDVDMTAREMVREFHIHVCSMEYPTVPEAEYPGSIEYLYETIKMICGRAEELHIDKDRLIIGGRSAGACLAAAICLLDQKRKDFGFKGLLLDHPWLDLCGLIPWDEENRYLGHGTLTKEMTELLILAYADPERQREACCTPLLISKEELAGFPPTVVQTCEKDSLRVEGDRFALLLEEAGVPFRHHCHPEAYHGFTQDDTPIGREGRAWIRGAMKELQIVS